MPQRIALLLALLGAALAPTRVAAELSEADCEADRVAFVAALAHDREQRLAAAREAMAEASGEARRSQLHQEGEQAWEHEEMMLGLADRNWRDCVAHVRRTSPG